MKNNYLYGLTVQGIQSYIFETNKLKEIIGASEIIEKLCTKNFNDFLKKNNLTGKSLLQAAGNIRFITDKSSAEIIFREFHIFLLKTTSGVPFSQAVVSIENNDTIAAIKDLDIKLRGQRNKPLQYIPLGNMIRSKYGRTGNFTSMVKYPFKKDEESTPKNIDLTTYRKLENCKGTILTSKLTFHEDYVFPTEFSELTEGGKDHWLALIHIDGNGMGNIIKDILKEGTADKLKEFSDNVDTATRAAFNTAMVNTFIQTYEKKEFKIDYRKMILPFRPLVLGGDDVTIIMRADFALNFTKIYLDEFEKNTQKANIQDGKGLTACAGIVYMKEKFPFHYAAHLAEELCGYAKDKSSRKASCLHFHKVQDSIYTDYKDIQKRELKASKIDFTTNPYYMDEQGNETTIDDLLTNTKKLFSDDAPRNKIREWVDACFNNPLMAEEIKKRISNFNNYIPKENETINYLTQLAITNYETKN